MATKEELPDELPHTPTPESDDNIKLIKLIKEYPFLYDAKDPRTKDRQLVNETWSTISSGTGLAVEEVKLKWHRLRSSFKKAIDRRGKAPTSGSAATKLQRPWCYDAELDFLKPYLICGLPSSSTSKQTSIKLKPGGITPSSSSKQATIKLKPGGLLSSSGSKHTIRLKPGRLASSSTSKRILVKLKPCGLPSTSSSNQSSFELKTDGLPSSSDSKQTADELKPDSHLLGVSEGLDHDHKYESRMVTSSSEMELGASISVESAKKRPLEESDSDVLPYTNRNSIKDTEVEDPAAGWFKSLLPMYNSLTFLEKLEFQSNVALELRRIIWNKEFSQSLSKHQSPQGRLKRSAKSPRTN